MYFYLKYLLLVHIEYIILFSLLFQLQNTFSAAWMFCQTFWFIKIRLYADFMIFWINMYWVLIMLHPLRCKNSDEDIYLIIYIILWPHIYVSVFELSFTNFGEGTITLIKDLKFGFIFFSIFLSYSNLLYVFPMMKQEGIFVPFLMCCIPCGYVLQDSITRRYWKFVFMCIFHIFTN